jgi:hypothetical protein
VEVELSEQHNDPAAKREWEQAGRRSQSAQLEGLTMGGLRLTDRALRPRSAGKRATFGVRISRMELSLCGRLSRTDALEEGARIIG